MLAKIVVQRTPGVLHSFLWVVVVLTVACANPKEWSSTDSAAVSDMLTEYRAAWLKGDPDSVMAFITDDAVLYVPGPVGTLAGRDRIKAYWFPPSGDTTYPIKRYDVEDIRVTGAGDLAVVEGRSILGWKLVVRDSTLQENTSTSEFLAVARRQEDRWLISRNMFVTR